MRVGLSASSFRTSDSTLYAWAASPDSPIDIVGFSFFPSPVLGGGIQSDTRTADRWMRVTPPSKEHWVFAVGGYPLAYGEHSQSDAVWEVLAWATEHPAIKGAVDIRSGRLRTGARAARAERTVPSRSVSVMRADESAAGIGALSRGALRLNLLSRSAHDPFDAAARIEVPPRHSCIDSARHGANSRVVLAQLPQ